MDQQNSSHNSSPREYESNKAATLFVTALVLFFISFITSGINVALPLIGQEFAASAVLLTWVVSAELLSIGVFLLPVGRISDIAGIKKVFLWGVALFGLTCVVAAQSNSVGMLIAVLAVQGIACAMVFGNSMAMLTAVFPARERGRAFGVNAACVYAGMSLGPYLGGMLIEQFGWRTLFYLVVPACLVALAVVSWKIKTEWCEARGEKLDTVGSAIIGISLIAFMYGFSLLPEMKGAALTTAGVFGLVGFLKWETSANSPILDLAVFRRNKFLLFSNAANFLAYAATNAVILLMSLYLQYIKALTPGEAGLLLLAQPAMLVIFSTPTGVLADKFEPRIVATSGMALIFGGLLIFAFLQENSSLAMILLALVLSGLGFALFITPNNNAIMGSVLPKHYGVASSLTATLRQIGQTLSLGITMIILSMIMGTGAITPEHYGDFVTSARLAFAIFAALAFGCIFVSLLRGKAVKK